ncbi:hypothetical protein E4U11_005225 [Claviceps purpurea]|nr:hypothetical protein E4U11_005225 [Claviceps purpurea]
MSRPPPDCPLAVKETLEQTDETVAQAIDAFVVEKLPPIVVVLSRDASSRARRHYQVARPQGAAYLLIGQVDLIPYVEDGECVESHATSSSRAKPRRQPQAAPRQERPRVDDREGTVI